MNLFYILSGPLGLVMRAIYNMIGNYGITIILFTVLVRICSFPLQISQQKNTAKMAVFQPMINEIQTKYKNNQEKQSEELMRLQKEYGYSPTAGCMPMVLNMFVLFGVIGAVYYPLQYILKIPKETITSIMEGLGIANRLTAETTIIQMAHNGETIAGLSAEQYQAAAAFNVDFFGLNLCDMPKIGFNIGLILPVLACVTMIISNIITMSTAGQQMQGSMKMMPWMLSIFFGYFCFTVPLAFSLYYTVSNILMLAQNMITKKIYDPEKMKQQMKEEMEQKKKEAKKQKTVSVTNQETGEVEEKTMSAGELAKYRLELARKQDEEKYAGEITERRDGLKWPPEDTEEAEDPAEDKTDSEQESEKEEQ